MESQDKSGILVLLIFCLFFIALGLVACSPSKPLQFERGQCVVIKLTQEKAMVINRWKPSRSYFVRVANATKVSHAFIGADNSYTEAYAVVSFDEFELTECEGGI